MKKDSKVLFEEIMDSLFSDSEKEKTLEDYKKSSYNGLPKEEGIYVVKNSKNKKTEILEKTEIKLLENPKTVKSQNKYEEGFLEKCKKINKKYLYIGKTTKTVCLNNRLKRYIEYGYGKNIDNHFGGYHLWFVKNNKALYANFATIAEIEKKQPDLYKKAKELSQFFKKPIIDMAEIGLICLHDLAYGYAPLANSQKQKEYESYKKGNDTSGYRKYYEWKKYWENVLN